MKALVSELYGNKKLDEGTHRMIAKMDKSKDHKIGRKEFQLGCKSFPQLLYPAFSIQSALRKYVVGESFWDEKSKSAARYCGQLAVTLFPFLTLFICRILTNPQVIHLLGESKRKSKKTVTRISGAAVDYEAAPEPEEAPVAHEKKHAHHHH